MDFTFTEFSQFINKTTSTTNKKVKSVFNKQNVNYSKKIDGTLITETDLYVEHFIRQQIENYFPNHSYAGEEFPDIKKPSPYCWVIDPIDGTYNFANQVPFFGTLVGLMKDNLPIYGSLSLPMIDDALLIGEDKQTFLNGRTIRSTKFKNWSNSLILTTDYRRLEKTKYISSWNILLDKGATCRTWGDCYGYYLLCIGIADVMVDIDMKSHDIVPLIPILKGAGIELIELSRNDNLISVIAFKSEITEEIKKLFR